MKRKRYTEAQIAFALRQAESGISVARFFHPLVRILAKVSQREMVCQIEYLETKNGIL